MPSYQLVPGITPRTRPHWRALKPLPAELKAIRARLPQSLGPTPLFRLRGKERAQVVVKAPDRRSAIDQVDASVREVSAARPFKAVAFSVDVDPQ